MLKNHFDHKNPYRFARYGRMSDPGQNVRSPEQQYDTIDRVRTQMKLPWQHVVDYRDDHISGRYERKRKGFQQMMRDLRTGKLVVDLILVDNIERFARLEELPHIRKQLFDRFGVLVLTADTGFADPNSPQGRVMSSFEALRACEEGRLKGRQVLRGKRDAAKLGHWPGGPVPFGLKLKNVMIMKNGVEEVDYRIPVRDDAKAWIIKLLFDKAVETAWGGTRLARWLNDNPDIPANLKPFEPETVSYWLQQELYYSELVWEKHCTDILDDTRIVQPNPEEDVLHVLNFCEALVDRHIWDVVNDRRKQRGAARRAAAEAKAARNGKQIHAPAPGMVITYPLSGLVRCGHCGRAMRVSSSAVYTTKAGESHRYVSYGCSGHAAGLCPNSQHVSEAWLRRVIFAKLRERLFPERA